MEKSKTANSYSPKDRARAVRVVLEYHSSCKTPGAAIAVMTSKRGDRGLDFEYRGITAQWHGDRAAQRPKAMKLARNTALRASVQNQLAGLIATPEAIAFDGTAVQKSTTVAAG